MPMQIIFVAAWIYGFFLAREFLWSWRYAPSSHRYLFMPLAACFGTLVLLSMTGVRPLLEIDDNIFAEWFLLVHIMIFFTGIPACAALHIGVSIFVVGNVPPSEELRNYLEVMADDSDVPKHMRRSARRQLERIFGDN